MIKEQLEFDFEDTGINLDASGPLTTAAGVGVAAAFAASRIPFVGTKMALPVGIGAAIYAYLQKTNRQVIVTHVTKNGE